MKRSLPCLLALLLTMSLAGCYCTPGGYPAAYEPCGGGGYCGAPMGGPCGPAPYGCQPGCCILQPVFCVLHGVENVFCCLFNPCGYGHGGCGGGCNNYCGMPSMCDPCGAPNLCCDPCGPVCGDPCGWDSCCPAPICCPPTNCCPSPCGPTTYGMGGGCATGDCQMGAPPMAPPPAAAPSVPPAANPPGGQAYFQRSGLIQSSATYSDARNQRWIPERY